MAVAQTVTGFLNMTANFFQTPSSGLQTTPYSELVSDLIQYVNNTGVNFGVDQLYAAKTTLVATTTNLHFETATLKDPFGNNLAMLRIRELIIQNTDTTLTHVLKVSASASNGITWLPPAANFLPCNAGSVIRISDPLSFGGGVGNVVGATTDGLLIDAGANTITFNILVLGCSVA